MDASHVPHANDDDMFDISNIDESMFQDHPDDYDDEDTVVQDGDVFEDLETAIAADAFANAIESMRPMIKYDKGQEQMNNEFLGELVRKGLFGFRYNFGSNEEICTVMNDLRKNNFFTSQHDNNRRSLSISTSRSNPFTVMSTMLCVPMFQKFFEWIAISFVGTITKVWAYHFIEEGSGKFVFHRDKFKSAFRIIFTLGD
jgi:hypothetical protein